MFPSIRTDGDVSGIGEIIHRSEYISSAF